MLERNIEITRQAEMIVATLTGLGNQLVITKPLLELLLPNEIIKKMPTEKIRHIKYKKPAELIIERIKELKINKEGIALQLSQITEDLYQNTQYDPSKLVKALKRNKFVGQVHIEHEKKELVIIPATVYNRTLTHELNSTRELLSLFVKTTDFDFKEEHKFLNEKLRAVMNTMAIRKLNNDFHKAWSLVYDRFERLTKIDLRAEFEKEPTSKFENRLDYALSKYRAEIIEAVTLVVLEN